MSEKYIGIDFNKQGAVYAVSVDAPLCEGKITIDTEFTREELKGLRNMVHNLLLDLNQELNYEK